MKTYKHKNKEWYAQEQREPRSTKYNFCVNNEYSLPEEFFIDSNDREEVIEKDWIEELYDNLMCDDDYCDFREIVEKYAPKQKKITEEQFKKVASDNNWGYTSLYMNRLWNLLYDNELIEDFEY